MFISSIYLFIYLLKSPDLSHCDPLNVYLGSQLEVGMQRLCCSIQCGASWTWHPCSTRKGVGGSDLVKISINCLANEIQVINKIQRTSLACLEFYPEVQENHTAWRHEVAISRMIKYQHNINRCFDVLHPAKPHSPRHAEMASWVPRLSTRYHLAPWPQRFRNQLRDAPGHFWCSHGFLWVLSHVKPQITTLQWIQSQTSGNQPNNKYV